MTKILIYIIIAMFSFACSLPNKKNNRADTVGDLICKSKNRKEPIGGTFSNGLEVVNKAIPNSDAETFFKEGKFVLLLAESSLTPPGVPYPKDALNLHESGEFLFCTMPQTGDVFTKENRAYKEAIFNYANDFNLRMLALKKESK